MNEIFYGTLWLSLSHTKIPKFNLQSPQFVYNWLKILHWIVMTNTMKLPFLSDSLIYCKLLLQFELISGKYNRRIYIGGCNKMYMTIHEKVYPHDISKIRKREKYLIYTIHEQVPKILVSTWEFIFIYIN